MKYHTCINDCFIYRDDYPANTKCLVCNADRYKNGKKSPRKVVWYFPLIPHLQQYFTDCKEEKLMRWHAERMKKPDDDEEEDDKFLTHQSDVAQWEALDI
jgi:hypothetical protein